MIISHKVGTPCPPSRPGLTVGAGSVRTDGTDDWCCHASPLFDLHDVDEQVEEHETRKAAPANWPEESRATHRTEHLEALLERRDADQFKHIAVDAEGVPTLPDHVRVTLDGLAPKENVT